MSALLDSAPYGDSVVLTDEQSPTRREPFFMASRWINWISFTLIPRVQTALQFLKQVALTNQSASIGATAVPLGVLAAGTYRLAWYGRITVADGVSSSLTVTMRWVDGGVTCARAKAAMTGDTTSTVDSDVFEVVVDGSSVISYATTYASNTPAKMRYALAVTVTRVN